MESLRRIWNPFFKLNWKFSVSLILLFGIPRFILVLQANASGSYGQVVIIFLLMWFTPLLFLSKKGRREIGIKRPSKYLHLLYAFLIGIAVCSAIFIVFQIVYKNTIENAFVYIAQSSGTIPADILPSDKLIYFIIATIPSMLFSPIGEELLYRGIIHKGFADKLGDNKASVLDSLAFALTHLAHFGIIYNMGHWNLLFFPSALWIISMFLASRIFFKCSQTSRSIFGAILSHAGFNFAMMYFIFYHLF